MHAAAPSLSVVVPCYNEELVLDALHDRLARVCDALAVDHELVFINDGSKDATWTKMTALAARDPNMVCVNLSRNHGHQLALTAGLSVCQGDQILIIDADLQDPPEALPEMLALMARERADVVYGQRASRQGETFFKRATAYLFYRALGWLADAPIPQDTGDFRLMTRRVLDQFLSMPERHRFVRGMVSWLGYKQVPYLYERHPRAAGETHYTIRKMVRFAGDAVTGFSVKPLALPLRVGGLCGAAAVVTTALAGWWWVAHGEIPSVGLLAALVLLLAGGQFLTLGVIGEYLGRMYTEVRGRPLYVIEQVVRGQEAATLPVGERARREVA
ncbi:glycosyltransferase family 2 protein [Fimbriiglobus ruber]|uniref:Glycosyltransferase n=1 Tax=Fimbriiglobus ruber TaxID=1908690 RepID=A0A225DJV4_9BACT|nr:glycosyltransferase family 2 protein [Fimbriiglobus ruber]OWK37726.1 Glycosyltransferase [Fimbriiglobus ruber]